MSETIYTTVGTVWLLLGVFAVLGGAFVGTVVFLVMERRCEDALIQNDIWWNDICDEERELPPRGDRVG